MINDQYSLVNTVFLYTKILEEEERLLKEMEEYLNQEMEAYLSQNIIEEEQEVNGF